LPSQNTSTTHKKSRHISRHKPSIHHIPPDFPDPFEAEEEKLPSQEYDVEEIDKMEGKFQPEYVLPPECCEEAPRTSRIEDFNGGNMDMIWFSKIRLGPLFEIIHKPMLNPYT